MTAGKAIAQAVRGHFIADAVLNALLLVSIFNVTIPGPGEETEEILETTAQQESNVLKEASVLYNNIILKALYLQTRFVIIAEINKALAEKMEHLKSSRRA